MKFRVALLLVFVTGGCSLFTPPQMTYRNELLPREGGKVAGGELRLDAGTVTFALEGLRVKVEPMDDDVLNALFPEDSAKGLFSTNPYTYGDWVDPVKGYRPKRFTVFRVSVNNDIYAKVLLDPLKAQLHTDQGEALNAYGIPSFAPHGSFERYYRALRGQSGNEFYRFDLRMGNVRSSAYLEDQLVFKGERYSGLLAFTPLDPEVGSVRLVLREFVLKFDSSGQALETMDIAMDFAQSVEITEAAAGR